MIYLKKYNKNQRKEKIVIIVILIMLIFSYFEIKGNIRFGGILRDIIFRQTSNLDTNLSLSINDELKKENDKLKKYLELDYSLIDFEIINASVIERNTSYFLNEITINKGLNHGVSKNQIVVDENGMIGKVISSSFNTSKVKLITGFENPISVKVNNVNKLLINDENLIIRGINTKDNIKKGDRVVTSGLSDIFPSGILIGSVEEIQKENDDVGFVAKVKLSSNIDELMFVSVLKRREK
mgnify:CR=1 FL=1